MAHFLIIEGSTRPARASKPIGDWVAELANTRGTHTYELVDLTELNLPFMDEPEHPALLHYTKDHTKKWSEKVKSADGVVLLVAEYNHGYTAPLKNALDFLFHEWENMPVAFLSYSGPSATAGVRALQALKPVVLQLGMRPVRASSSIPTVWEAIKDGVFTPTPETIKATEAMLDGLEAMVSAPEPATV